MPAAGISEAGMERLYYIAFQKTTNPMHQLLGFLRLKMFYYRIANREYPDLKTPCLIESDRVFKGTEILVFEFIFHPVTWAKKIYSYLFTSLQPVHPFYQALETNNEGHPKSIHF